MAFEEAMKYGGKVILGDRPVQVRCVADCWIEFFLFPCSFFYSIHGWSWHFNYS